MSGLTTYGTLWAAIPQTTGRIFWVAPGAGGYTVEGQTYRASDDNDGLSPQRALASVTRGVNLADGDGDVVVLLPGDHTVSEQIAMDTDNVTLMGLPGGAGSYLKPRTSLTISIDDNLIMVTAHHCEIAHLELIPITTEDAITLNGGNACHIHDCLFDMSTPAADTGTHGIRFFAAPEHTLIQRCYFLCDGAQGEAIETQEGVQTVIEDCTFVLTAGIWAACVSQDAAGRRLLVRRCDFQVGNGTILLGINGETGGEVSMLLASHCNFADSVTNPVDSYDAGDAEIVECYQAGLGAGDGGVLITATT